MDEQTKLRFEQISGAMSALSLQVQALIETHPDLAALRESVDRRAGLVRAAMTKTASPAETVHNFEAHLGNFAQALQKEEERRMEGFPSPRA